MRDAKEAVAALQAGVVLRAVNPMISRTTAVNGELVAM